MIARRADWKRAEQSAARFQAAIAAAQCGAVSGVRHPAITALHHYATAWARLARPWETARHCLLR